MQDEKEELKIKKELFLQTAGKISSSLRTVGKMKFALMHNIPGPSLGRFEKGAGDLQITTICRLANAHGLKCSEFIKLIEDELPADFTFRSN